MSLKNHFKSVHKVVKCESFTSTSRDLTSITNITATHMSFNECDIETNINLSFQSTLKHRKASQNDQVENLYKV